MIGQMFVGHWVQITDIVDRIDGNAMIEGYGEDGVYHRDNTTCLQDWLAIAALDL